MRSLLAKMIGMAYFCTGVGFSYLLNIMLFLMMSPRSMSENCHVKQTCTYITNVPGTVCCHYCLYVYFNCIRSLVKLKLQLKCRFSNYSMFHILSPAVLTLLLWCYNMHDYYHVDLMEPVYLPLKYKCGKSQYVGITISLQSFIIYSKRVIENTNKYWWTGQCDKCDSPSYVFKLYWPLLSPQTHKLINVLFLKT